MFIFETKMFNENVKTVICKGRCCFTSLEPVGNARILNMSEFQCGQMPLDMCNFVNML